MTRSCKLSPLRVALLCKVLKDQLALTLSFLADVDGLTDQLCLAQAELKRIGYGLARNPAFLVSTGRPKAQEHHMGGVYVK